jgi:choline dehydrogenase/5-(hydroxymethyl)furfural/furfural oxidase
MNGWRALDETACAPFQWHGLESRRTSIQEPRPHLRGKGLGGSSSVNGMIAIRAMADDYDRWAAEGCSGWSYDECCRIYAGWRDANWRPAVSRRRRPGPGAAPARPVGLGCDALAESALGPATGGAGSQRANRYGVSPYASAPATALATERRVSEPARTREPPGRRERRRHGAHRVGPATGVRARIGGEWVEARAWHRPVRGRDPLPAILLRSARRAGRENRVRFVGEQMQEHPRAAWLFARAGSEPGSTPGRRTAACATRPGWRARPRTT